MIGQNPNKLKPVADRIKLFFLAIEEFLRFHCQARSFYQECFFLYITKTLKLNSENWKTKRKNVLYDRLQIRL